MSVSETFDVNASFPADLKHRPTIEALVVHAAEYAGCSPEVARDFADEVGAAFSAGAGTATPNAPVGVRLERALDRIEVVVSCGQTVRISRPLVVAG